MKIGKWRNIMKFVYNGLYCDVDVFHNENGIVVRFYDHKKEPEDEQMKDLVIADSGYGFLCLKYKHGRESALISGFLDEALFSSEDMIDEAIEFLENLSTLKGDYCTYHHVDSVKLIDYVEYNGEYEKPFPFRTSYVKW